MSIKKLIAYITALAILTLSFNTAVSANGDTAELYAEPTAEVKTTSYSAYELKGNYEFVGDAEGETKFKWYQSDSFFGEYTEIDGENEITLKHDRYDSGKYIKFVVIPVEQDGTEGEPAEAIPVLTSSTANEAFSSDASLEPVNTAKFAEGSGSYGIADDPDDSENKVLRISRTSTSTDASLKMSMLEYTLPKYSNNTGAIIDADIYVGSDLTGGNWEMFYIMGYNSANSLAQVAKFYVSNKNSNLLFSGASNVTASDAFEKDTWHHLRIVMDFEEDKVKEFTVDGASYGNDIGFVKSADIKYVDYVRTYLQNETTGTGYIDNLSITPVVNTAGYAAADTDAIELETVIPLDADTVELPCEGTVNGAPIAWSSSDESIVTVENGVTAVIDRTACTENKQVVLTAHCVNGNDYSTRDFTFDIICVEASKSSIDEITLDTGYKVSSDFQLPETLSEGEAIEWKSSDSEVISIDGYNAVVKQTYSEKTVVLTASAIINGVTYHKEFTVVVEAKSLDSITPPVVNSVSISQKDGTRPVIAKYDYYDIGAYDEVNSIYQWYAEENGEYTAVEGENSLTFVPGSEFGGRKIRFGVKPVNEMGVAGKEYLSEPLTYNFFKAEAPIAKITSKTINADKAFEICYEYSSSDLIEEADTSVTWYRSDSYNGVYTAIKGANGSIYKPTDESAYYKYVVIPKDAEGNEGTPVQVGPFMYADPNANQIVITKNAIAALSLPVETYLDIALPEFSEEGAAYTWVSSDESVMNSHGKIFRDSKDGANKIVNLTVYAVCGFETQTSEYSVLVNKFSNPPVISSQKLRQSNRPIFVDYEYTDADGNIEGATKYEWYYKAPGSDIFSFIEGADINRFAPDENMDNGTFKVRITPVDSTYTTGKTVETPEFTYTYKPSTKPTAVMGKTLYDTYKFTGKYTYKNTDGVPEGRSVYKWYISEKLFGEYTEIKGENSITLPYSKAPAGMYLKFVVIPVDSEGTEGEPVGAIPVLVASPNADTFDTDDSLSSIDGTGFAVGSGSYSIAADPQDSSNSALRLQRTVTTATDDTNNELKMSMIEYNIPNTRDTVGVIIDADVYAAAGLDGTWEMFYIFGASQAFKLYITGSNNHLYFQGDNSKAAASIRGKMTKDEWHHIRVVLDLQEQLVKEISLDGTVGGTDMELRSTISSVDYIRSYMQTTTTGTCYIDNLSVTPIVNSADYAREDANMIVLDTETDAVINNIKLPQKGSLNGSSITWTSSDEKYVVIEEGKRAMVTRPTADEGDKKVTITAHVVHGNDYYSRDIELNIVRKLNDSEIADRDYDRLNDYDNMIADSKITFPETGKFGARYEWTSSDESIIANDGTVYQTDDKQDVYFDVKITSGDASMTRRVMITVAPVRSENLLIKGGIDASSSDEKYPSANARDDDYTTAWKSVEEDKSPFIIMDMGMYRNVNRLYVADKGMSVKSFTLSASKDKINWTDVKVNKGVTGENIFVAEFDTINTRYIRADLVCDGAASANELALMYDPAAGDNAQSSLNDITLPIGKEVKDDFELPSALNDGTRIEWKSSDNDVISINGSKANVTRQSKDKSVTLTAAVTIGGKTAEKLFVVVVEGKGDSASSGGGGGSSSGGRSNGGVTSAAGSGVPVAAPVVQQSIFTDIASVPWAVDVINKLAAAGIVNGTGTGTFEPSRSITREEFAAILYRGFGFDSVAVNGEFSDVKSSDWYYEPVMQLSSLGIVKGIGEGSFGVGKTITRQDMAVMIYRAAIAANAQFAAAGTEFADAYVIAGYAKSAVDALSGAQIINGVGEGRFNPLGNATRAEATVILGRILDYIP